MSALPEARESLSYWEDRLQKLPRRALRQRREAREMCVRWRERVMEAERAQYGAGMLGAALQLLVERRLPTSTRHTTQQVVRAGTVAAVSIAVTTVALCLLVLVAVLSLIF
jgi:hypothetical protein